MSGDQKYKGMMSYATIPEPCSGFVMTEDFRDAQKKFLHRDTVALILEGVNGSGKSEIAYKLVQDLELRERQSGRKVLPLLFNSSKRKTLVKDLVNFCNARKLGVVVESLANFKKIFESLNQTPFADSVKCLLFDDMVDKDEMEILNSTVVSSLESLNNGDRDKKDKWKFIVTTHHQPRDITCGKLLATFSVKGYSQDEALQFFQREQGVHLPDAMIRELHKLMRGSPLGLRFAKQDLEGKGDEECNSYIQRLRKRALQHSKYYNTEGEKYIIASIVISLEAKLKDDPMLSNMLPIISFYHKNNIMHDMLIACMEIRSPNTSHEKISADVGMFRLALEKHLFQSVKIAEEHGLQKLSIHQLVMTALRQLCHANDSLETQQSNCRDALTALVRVIETDGRFEENAEMNSCHVQHAMTLLKFIKKKEKQHTTFCDVTMKMMRAQVRAAIGYIYLRGRNLITKGNTMLLSARDELCSLINGYEDLVVTDKPEEDQASEIGVKLYEKMVQMDKQEHYKEHVTYVPVYQRLTPREWTSLGLMHRDRKHLRDNDHLDILRRDGKALPNDMMISIYVMELAASIFCTLARSASFHIEGMNRETVLKDSKKNAQIAIAVYNQLWEQHNIVILNQIIVQHEELHIRLELIENDANTDERNAALLHEIIQKTEGLRERKENAYEFGLRRSILKEDNYHNILCNVIIMRASGLLYRLERDHQCFKRANELFDDCIQRAQDEFKKNDCLSHVHQCWAKVLSICGEKDKAVSEGIKSIRLLVEEREKVIIEMLKKGRFLELCKLVQTFVEKGGEPSDDDKRYISSLATKCKQNLLKGRADVLHYILEQCQGKDDCHPLPPTDMQKKKDLQPEHALHHSYEESQSAPNAEDTPDGSGLIKETKLPGDKSDPPIEVTPTTNPDIVKLYNTDEVYKMSKIRGRALIFDNIQNPEKPFCEHQKRCERLMDLFQKMDFEPEVLKATVKLKTVIKEETKKEEHKRYGMFVLVLMSHRQVQLTELLDLLSSEKFPSMHGKPKIVFIQGFVKDAGASKSDLEFDSGKLEPVVNHRDIAVVTSSFTGPKADGNTEMGSWFITSLVDVFSKQSCHLEFYKLIMEVGNEVEEKCHKYNEGKAEKDRVDQLVIFRHGTLGKKLYFFPSIDETSAAQLIYADVTLKHQGEGQQSGAGNKREEKQLPTDCTERDHETENTNSEKLILHEPKVTQESCGLHQSPKRNLYQPSEVESRSASNAEDAPDGSRPIGGGDKMSPEIRGCALIINMTFVGQSENWTRSGSEKDCDKLLCLFNDMNFTSSIHTDDKAFKPDFPAKKNKVLKTAKDLKRVISEETAKDEHKRSDIFVLALMSHGTETAIHAPDKTEVQLTDLLDLLSSEMFPSMHGKTKIVLIQACAGEGYGIAHVERNEVQPFVKDQDIDDTASFEETQASSSNIVPQHIEYDIVAEHNVSREPKPNEKEPKLVYHHRDIAVVTASFKGNKSARVPKKGNKAARDEQIGSLFITSLVDVFRQHAGNLEFYDMIMKVGNDVGKKCSDKGYLQNNGFGQAVTFRYGTLRKPVYFPAAPTAAAASNQLSSHP